MPTDRWSASPTLASACSLARAAQARRVALAAQGFLDPRHAVPTMRTFQRTLARTGVLQVDSVNVLQRAHYMPLYSRMGPYDIDLLRRAAERRPRRIVEYWAHVQAFMPVELWPLMQHRMDALPRQARHKWWDRRGATRSSSRQPARRGRATAAPSTARDLDDGLPREKEHWGWNWSDTRRALDYLFMVGDLAIAGRNSQFELLYDLPERVHPARGARARRRRRSRTPTGSWSAGRPASHGVATARCLRDYYRMRPSEPADRPRDRRAGRGGRAAAGARSRAGTRPAYLHRDARLPAPRRTPAPC